MQSSFRKVYPMIRTGVMLIAFALMLTFGSIISFADNASELSANPDIIIARADATMVKGQKFNVFLYDRNNIGEMVYPVSGVVWTSSKPKVASVSADGVVKAKKAGKAVIRGSYGGKTYSCSVNVYKSLSSKKREKLAKKAAKQIVKTCIRPGMSQPMKALVLADYIYQNVYNQYDQSTKRYKKNYGNEAYAALVMHLAACSGHCKAYKMLCKAAGLKCKHVNAGKWTHQWNKVYLDGKWVMVDTQAGIMDYPFTDSEYDQSLALTFDYNHFGPIYLKLINGLRQ